MTTTQVHENQPIDQEHKDPLIPCFKAVDAVLHEWEIISRSPKQMNILMVEFPGLSVELRELSEIWGESSSDGC